MRALPTGWTWTRFANVAVVRSNLVDPKRTPNAPHVAPNHIESWTTQLLPFTTVAEDKVTSGKHAFFAGQILYSKIRPYLAKVAMVDFDGLCSADMYPIESRIESRYLLRWMASPEFTELASQSQGRTVLPKINQDALNRLPVPVPPLNEQRRIVAKIDALMARSRRAKESLDAIPPLLERLRQSILAAAFRGDLTADWRAQNPDVEPADKLLERIRTERRRRWEEATLEKMRAKGKEPAGDGWKAKYEEPAQIGYGDLPELPSGWGWASLDELSRAERPICYGVVQPGEHEVEDGVGLVRVCDLVDGLIDFEGVRTISREIHSEYSRSELEGTEVLVSIVGTVGRVAVATDRARGMNIARAVARIAPVELATREWIARWLSTSFMQEWLGRDSREVARKTLNIDSLRRAPVPLGPIAEMTKVIEAVTRGIDRLADATPRTEQAVERLAALQSAILAKAFRGELVPQDPNDEPAEQMLARLAGSTETSPAKGRRGRPRRKDA